MNLFVLVMFLHLLGALALFMSFAVEWVIQSRVRASASLEQARPFLEVGGKSVPILGAIGGILVLLPGLYLTNVADLWNMAWIQAAIGTAVVIALLGVIITGPRMRSLAASAAGHTKPGAEPTRFLRDPLLVISLRVRVTLALGVLFLMAAEPTFMVTMLTMGIAFFVGVLISVPAWTHRAPDPL
jgi:hypothetical protein